MIQHRTSQSHVGQRQFRDQQTSWVDARIILTCGTTWNFRPHISANTQQVSLSRHAMHLILHMRFCQHKSPYAQQQQFVWLLVKESATTGLPSSRLHKGIPHVQSYFIKSGGGMYPISREARQSQVRLLSYPPPETDLSQSTSRLFLHQEDYRQIVVFYQLTLR